MIKNKYFYITCLTFSLFFLDAKLDQDLWCKNHIVKYVHTPHKVVALTFDDGPHEKTTAQILAVLKQKKIHATFFTLGENANQHPDFIQQELMAGHEIGNHGYTHAYLNQNSKNTIEKEINHTEEEILKAEKAVSSDVNKPVLFRPPGGLYNKKLLETALSLGYTTVLWTIDTRDWDHMSTQKIVSSVLNNVKPGSIILLHDGLFPLATPEAVQYIIDNLQQQGYEFVTVSELLQLSDQNEGSRPPSVYEW